MRPKVGQINNGAKISSLRLTLEAISRPLKLPYASTSLKKECHLKTLQMALENLQLSSKPFRETLG